MIHKGNNEKISLFSRSLILENGIYLINVKNDNIDNYKWWKNLFNPQDSFNPSKSKGFLVFRLLLYGYLNRISTGRSNKDNDLMHPYLKILLNDVEIYRTKILCNPENLWDDKLEIQIHYIKSKIEIQLYDMDETEGVVEDEYIGSAFINICDLELYKKYDIIIKYANKISVLTDSYDYKKKTDEECNNRYYNKKKNSINENIGCRYNETYPSDDVNDYNVRIFAKLVNKSNYSRSVLCLNTITSLNYKYIYKTNDILEKELDSNQLYNIIKAIKLNIDTIWIPFFSIIYNFASWNNPIYSSFFVIFFCLSFVFSKFLFSFFLLALSLILFILVSIIKEIDKLKSNSYTICNDKLKKKTKKKNRNKKNNKYPYFYANNQKYDKYRNMQDKDGYVNKDHMEYSNILDNSLESKSGSNFDSTNTESSIYSLSDDNRGDRREGEGEDSGAPFKNKESDNDNEDSDCDSENNFTDGVINVENNLYIIKTFILSVIEDDIINNIKYIHYILFCITSYFQSFYYILGTSGYLLVIFTLLLCTLNIFFYPIVANILRFLFFSSGFILLTYNFKPINIFYRFFICLYEYYLLKTNQRHASIFNN